MNKRPAYPGRDQLDAANMLFRRNLARAHREAARHDPSLLPDVERIAVEAANVLGRLAEDAQAVYDSSKRVQAGLKAAEDKTRAVLKKAARRGSTQAAAILTRLDERSADDDG